MSTPALSRAEFIRLLLPTDEEIEQEVEGRRLRKCAELARAIAEIVDQPQQRGRSYRQIAAELGVDEGTRAVVAADRGRVGKGRSSGEHSRHMGR